MVDILNYCRHYRREGTELGGSPKKQDFSPKMRIKSVENREEIRVDGKWAETMVTTNLILTYAKTGFHLCMGVYSRLYK